MPHKHQPKENHTPDHTPAPPPETESEIISETAAATSAANLEANTAQEQSAPSEQETVASKLRLLEQKTLELEQIILQQKEDVLRAYAEMENFKKRKEQEMQHYRKLALEQIVMDLLPALDGFDRACEHSKDGQGDWQEILKGFLLIQKQFQSVLEKNGVTSFECLGQKMDPNLHQTISMEEAPGKETNTILREVQRGYKLHSKVVRPSLVVVAQ